MKPYAMEVDFRPSPARRVDAGAQGGDAAGSLSAVGRGGPTSAGR